jgi:hypothetical protein
MYRNKWKNKEWMKMWEMSKEFNRSSLD